MLDVVTANSDLLMLGDVEPALHDARRLLTVASFPNVAAELAAPVLDAAANRLAVVIEAIETASLASDMIARIANAEECLGDAVSALVEANEGGSASAAREAIDAALAAVESLIDAATIEHGSMREAA